MRCVTQTLNPRPHPRANDSVPHSADKQFPLPSMLIIALIVLSAMDRMTLERNHILQTVVKMG